MEEQIPEQGISHLCLNCQSPLQNKAAYCHSCGQKNTNKRITVKELFSQFFDKVFNLDSKIFRTLGAVFIPGKLTNAFLSGQRQKYYHPIRLFLVLLLIVLAALSFQNDLTPPGNLNKEQIDKLKERKRLMGVLDSGIESISDNTEQATVFKTLDSLSASFYRNSGKRVDSININDAVKLTDDFDFYIAVEDIGRYSPDEILEKYKVSGFFKRLIVRQKVKMIEDGTSFMPFLLGKATWSVLIVLLLLTLVFKLLYFKSDFLYLEHLIFGIHLLSFFSIIASILILIPWLQKGSIIPWIFLVMAIYLFIALRRVYKQSYFLTFLKCILVIACYFFSFILGIVITVVGSFLIF